MNTLSSNQIPTSIIPIKKTGKDKSIFFIHALSGFGFEYFSLASYLDDYDLYVINDPKINIGDEKFHSITEMASQYLQFIKTIQKDGPYLLSGWSFGGFVAYEIAAQLLKEKAGQVVKVILIDTPCMQKYADNFNAYKAVEYIIQKGIQENSNEFTKLVSEMENNITLARNYIPQNNPNLDVFLLKSKEILNDPIYTFVKDTSNGWDATFVKENNIMYINGNHLTLFEKENAKDCANKIHEILKMSL
jgi:thioesterase domain-containing protein